MGFDDYVSPEDSALYVAAEAGDLATVQSLLDGGEDINFLSDWDTPLGIAVQNGHEHIVELLLRHGADASLTNEVPPLMVAVLNNFEKMAEMLVFAGADVNGYSHELFYQTALMWAARDGLREIVILLLQHGADTTMRDWFGFTASENAANEEIAQLIRSATK